MTKTVKIKDDLAKIAGAAVAATTGKKAKTKASGTLKLKLAIINKDYSTYVDGIANTNKKLYAMLGQVAMFGKLCLDKRNIEQFRTMLKDHNYDPDTAIGDNAWLYVVRLAFGEWEVKLDKDGAVIVDTKSKQPKQYWVTHSSCGNYANVLRYFDWLEVAHADVAGEIERMGSISAVIEADKKLRKKAGIRLKAEADKETKLQTARDKISGVSELGSFKKPEATVESGSFVLLIGQVDDDGEVTVKSFAKAGVSTIDSVVNATGNAKVEDEKSSTTETGMAEIIRLNERQRKAAQKANADEQAA